MTTDPSHPSTSRAAVLHRLAYGVAGLVIGAVWIWNRNLAPWKHALRLLVLVLVLVPIGVWARNRILRRLGRPLPPPDHVRGLVVMKVALVVFAFAGELLFGLFWSRAAATEIVSVLLVLVVAFGGPPAHDWIARGARLRARPAVAEAPEGI